MREEIDRFSTLFGRGTPPLFLDNVFLVAITVLRTAPLIPVTVSFMRRPICCRIARDCTSTLYSSADGAAIISWNRKSTRILMGAVAHAIRIEINKIACEF
jgi:hypothetical protein